MLSTRKLRIGILIAGLLAAGVVAYLWLTVGKSPREIAYGDGRGLAMRHCGSCHQLTEPDLLTKRSWEFCLTYMGFFLGVVDYDPLDGSTEAVMDIIHAREEFVRTAGMFPETPALSAEDWQMLRQYYVSNAPEVPHPQEPKPEILEDLALFTVKPTTYRQRTALTSLVHIDEAAGRLLVHDGLAEQLTILDADGDLIDRHAAPGVALVDAASRGDEIYLLNIGDLFASRIGQGFGELQRAKRLGGIYMGLEILLESLHRPADLAFADLNNDGAADALISNFGDYTGNLSLFYRDPTSGGFVPEPVILSTQPGIVKSEAHDFDGDGLPDIAVLASAAMENLSIFVNQGDGSFSQRIITRKHPSFGYTSLELRDFNDDGRMDILTLNGDNGDSDPYNTLKRDHGMRIYLNQGNVRFEEAWFYPMYGVFGAEVEDFDLDGDLDIAAVAFHPDFNQPKRENFVYLEQTASLTFAPKTHSATYEGRWMTIDAGDLDGDGDQDLVLGAGYSPVGMRVDHEALLGEMMAQGPPLLVLQNTARE